MDMPKPRPIRPIAMKPIRPKEEEGLFYGMDTSRVFLLRISIDTEAEQVLVTRAVAEGRVMYHTARSWFTLGRVEEIWSVVSDGMEYDWILVIPDDGNEFLMGHIGLPDDFLWVDRETIMKESTSGFVSRLTPGKPKTDEAVLKGKKDVIDFSLNRIVETSKPRSDDFGPVMVKKDLDGIPPLRPVFGENLRDEFIAWTDGSYITNGSLRGSAVVTSTGYWAAAPAPAGSGKAEYSELYAILLAVSHGVRTKAKKVTIKSDSQAALFAVERWLEYSQNQVQFTNVKMRKVLNRIRDLVEKYPVEFKFSWVKGHVGNPGNESADRLARLTARRCAVGGLDISDDEAKGILVDTGAFSADGNLLIKK